jgi:hypothetical protein
MAGSSQYTAVLDANTLYPAPLRDLLLSLAVDGLYHARWTARIHEEWVRNLTGNRPELEPRLGALVDLMNRSVPDCLVENYEGLIEEAAPFARDPEADRKPPATGRNAAPTGSQGGHRQDQAGD